jgi:hypothetical protein
MSPGKTCTIDPESKKPLKWINFPNLHSQLSLRFVFCDAIISGTALALQ